MNKSATPRKDLSGKTFNKLTVVRFSHRNEQWHNYWICRCSCGKETTLTTRNIVSGRTKSCGCLQKEKAALRTSKTGDAGLAWKGGRATDPYGYVQITVKQDPKSRRTIRVPEHRLVMERHLGRALLPEETIHHKNGIRSDNRIENLELWSTSHSNGQRVEDLVDWAEKFLRQYEPECLADFVPEILTPTSQPITLPNISA